MLAIHDVRGRLVDVPVSGTLGPGWHEVAWGGEGVAPGVYLVTMTAPGHRFTQRFTVVR